MKREAAKIYFDSLKLTNYKFVNFIGKKSSGQANAIEVLNINADDANYNKEGVFRLLKRTEEIDIKRFQRELRILTNEKYKHPNIINILAFPKDSESYWYVSEKGENFETYWLDIKNLFKDNQDKLLDKAIDLILKILDGLTILHNQNVVHRDIKPDNLIIVKGEPVLIDFGIAFDEQDERVTPIDGAVGNRGFSPDQTMNRMEFVPAWLDIFQISQLLIWMLTKSAKAWSRPLDWKWVIYPEALSGNKLLSLKALNAVCSVQNLAPNNALEMVELINNLFKTPKKLNQIPSEINSITEKIRSNKIKSLIVNAEDINQVESSYPLLEKFYLDLRRFLKSQELDEIEMQIKLIEYDFDLVAWKKTIIQGKNYEKAINPISIRGYAGTETFFQIGIQIHYYKLSSEKSNDCHIPEGCIPFIIRINHGSNNDNCLIKKSFEIFIAIDRKGRILRSTKLFTLKFDNIVNTSEELFKELRNMFYDAETWDLIQE